MEEVDQPKEQVDLKTYKAEREGYIGLVMIRSLEGEKDVAVASEFEFKALKPLADFILKSIDYGTDS